MTRHAQTQKRRSSAAALSHVTHEITRLLERGVMPWRAPWDEKLALKATPGLPLRATGEPYRGANTVLLWASQIARGYSKRTWMTFRQAIAVGAHVRKGEKATPVIYYGQAKSKVDDRPHASSCDDAKSYRFLKFFYVFNADQLDDLPGQFAVETAPPPQPASAIEAWAKRAEARIRVGGASAYYSPTTDTIHLPPANAFRDEDARIATLCHELAHHTGAAHRLDRLKDYFTDRTARAKEELTAEIAGAVVCTMIGLKPDHLEDHAAYLKEWLGLASADPRAFLSAAAKAQAAVDWLIAKAGDPTVSDVRQLETATLAIVRTSTDGATASSP